MTPIPTCPQLRTYVSWRIEWDDGASWCNYDLVDAMRTLQALPDKGGRIVASAHVASIPPTLAPLCRPGWGGVCVPVPTPGPAMVERSL
jgi:hypothetical protein